MAHWNVSFRSKHLSNIKDDRRSVATGRNLFVSNLRQSSLRKFKEIAYEFRLFIHIYYVRVNRVQCAVHPKKLITSFVK